MSPTQTANWGRRAACDQWNAIKRGIDVEPEDFYPHSGGLPLHGLRVCWGYCDPQVRLECRAFGLRMMDDWSDDMDKGDAASQERFGIWGGLTVQMIEHVKAEGWAFDDPRVDDHARQVIRDRRTPKTRHSWEHAFPKRAPHHAKAVQPALI